MLLFWQGRGWAVLPIMFGWIFLVIFVLIATMGAEADPNAAAANTDRTFALAFALAAANVFYLHWRWGKKLRAPAEPGAEEGNGVVPQDSFMFVPIKYWAYVFAAGAAYFLVHSFTV